MSFLEDSLVLALGRAIKAEEAAQEAFDAGTRPSLRPLSPTAWEKRHRLQAKLEKARDTRKAAERELTAFKAGPAASPEVELLARWAQARQIRDRSTGAKRQKYYALADTLQYELQDMSALGHRMVWGSEWAKERGDRR